MFAKAPARSLRRGQSSFTVLIVVLVVACVAIALACGGVLLGFVLPAINEARGNARYLTSVGHLKQLGLALHNYHDVFGTFPPPYIPDENGQPKHSWRVLILPYIEEQGLYDRYDFDEPWDGPNNILLIHERPMIFGNPGLSDEDATTTTYQAIAGPGTCFDPTGPAISMSQVTDGLANTLLLVENFGAPVVWTEPDDTSPEDFLAGEGLAGAPFQDMAVALMTDTSYHGIQKSDLKALRRATTRAAGD